ncbi:MAG: hypothetical protein ABEI54_04940, partial [Candidatus Bipolaricaulia bacterium]
RVADFPGPLTLVTEEASEEELAVAARLTARYSQGRDEDKLEAIAEKDGETKLFRVEPLDSESDSIEGLRIES